MTVFPIMPARINRLYELAYNLWWSWHPEARTLYSTLDPVALLEKELREVGAVLAGDAGDERPSLRHNTTILAGPPATRGILFVSGRSYRAASSRHEGHLDRLRRPVRGERLADGVEGEPV